MNAFLRDLPRLLGLAALFAAGVTLIGLKIWDDLQNKALAKTEHTPPPAAIVSTEKPDDVRNYVLFTQVKLGRFEIVTGTRYASSHTSEIAEQWCYVSEYRPGNPVSNRIDLARATGSGPVTLNPVSVQALRTIGLDAGNLRTLITDHCRFEQGAIIQ